MIAHESDIIIIGAGAAGLMAARLLATRFSVILLEAAPQPGGRIRTRTDPDSGEILEEGAEFVHGYLPLSLGLLKEAGLHFSPVKGDLLMVNKGVWKEPGEMPDGWEELLKTMEILEEDMTLDLFLRKFYPGDQYQDLRHEVVSYANGFDLADIEKVSVKALFEEWSQEDEDNFRIDKGYGSLIDFLLKEKSNQEKRLFIDTVVKKIMWKAGQVTAIAEDGRIFKAAKIIVTIPLPLWTDSFLKAGVCFEPAIEDYIIAARKIGYGPVIKMLLQFNKPFWQDYGRQPGFIVSDELFRTWWTPSSETSCWLTGWLGGPPALAFSQGSSKQILQQALLSLSGIFNIELSVLTKWLKQYSVMNWVDDPLSLGAYSYATPYTNKAIELINTPIAETIYFAGEALYQGKSPGTVEAALNSGKAAAEKILFR